ncbi:hypothetical protein ROP_69760 [Rhodococcus opacus B4]|uniref:Prohead serine protease domain-containing protein n=2 Tax=Rhodococcus opacus TaxID=37919 RepID=C1B4N4_RHOOB|nr:hypothetical protein ROP_69760 [Rhodococcus opacus B4]
METREYDFEARMSDVEMRQVTGLAVPYGQTIDLGGFQERVERGAFDTTKSVPLLWGHDHRDIPIGRVTAMRDTEHGLEIDAVLNDTDKGENVYRALKAGDVSKFSIGFIPTKSRKEGDVIVREKATLKEVSVVNFPAYTKASVTSVREADNKNNKENKMEDNFDYSAEIGEVRSELAELGRKFDKVTERDEQDTVQFRSAGEWMKALFKGDTEARDFATSVDADITRPAWINDGLKLVEKQRIVKGLFSQAPLPQSGNTYEYPYVKTQTGTVGVQANEGDNLAYLKLDIDTANAAVKTYGGYSSISRQAIERSDVAYLEAVLRFQTIAYANATEAAVQAALLATSATANEVVIDQTSTDAEVWIGAVLDAKAEIDDNSKLGLSADFIVISRDVHKKLATITDLSGRPVFAVNGDGQNTFGSLPLNGKLAGVIDGTPVVVGKNLAAGTVVVAASQALVSRESAGAPFRLTDENIVNLTKDYSVYGYFGVDVPDVKGITFIKDDGVS